MDLCLVYHTEMPPPSFAIINVSTSERNKNLSVGFFKSRVIIIHFESDTQLSFSVPYPGRNKMIERDVLLGIIQSQASSRNFSPFAIDLVGESID